ncbi:hypothetical protein L596_030909 [Steinernema carpocapsae]|uniref:Uncharacterized protein n=1 Tax=Steinernema carpocapsae TaxID=34508 RepID=A0A4U5MH72_STECR|nr:hypothetical protein L596_030909 [Steinernema carpocapsae]
MDSFFQIQSSDGLIFDFKLTWIPRFPYITYLIEQQVYSGPILIDDLNSNQLNFVYEWFKLQDFDYSDPEERMQIEAKLSKQWDENRRELLELTNYVSNFDLTLSLFEFRLSAVFVQSQKRENGTFWERLKGTFSHIKKCILIRIGKMFR